jgi:hypothetical protein
LAAEPEEEEASYLTGLNKAPDFIDEPPVEAHEVRFFGYVHSNVSLMEYYRDQRRRQSRQRADSRIYIFIAYIYTVVVTIHTGYLAIFLVTHSVYLQESPRTSHLRTGFLQQMQY